MRRIFLAVAALFALLATVIIVAPTASADGNAPIALAGCTTNTLAAGDDAVELAALGFTANIGDGGSGVASIYVSENGIVSFDGPIDYWYEGIDLRGVAGWFGDGDMELVAPFYADAVRDDGGSVTYGQTTYQGRSAFCVEWNDLTPWVPEFLVVPDPLPTNSFQLILVERNDRATDDFDVIVNYETIGWDDTFCEEQINDRDAAALAAPDPSNGCGCDFENENGCAVEVGRAQTQLAQVGPVFESDSVGALAGLAFPQGFSGQTIEFPGSGQIGEMVDTTGLAAKSLNSLQPGRFVVEIRNGFQNANLGIMQGSVSGPSGPVAQSLVSACTQAEVQPKVLEQVCVMTRTDDAGLYEFGGAPEGEYIVTAFAPPGSNLITESQIYELTTIFGIQTIPPFELEGPQPPADNVTLSPISGGGGSVTVYWNNDLDLIVTGCAGGSASWIVTASEGPSPLTGDLTEEPPGTYFGVIPALFPTHGNASITIIITCPGGATEETGFSLYIDPAGVVVDLTSGDPVPGAEVLLERRGQGEVEFSVVPDGSEIMSEANRSNPSITGDDGLFSWFTIPGQYRVTASASGCTSIDLPAEWADRVLTDVAEYDDAPAASMSPILEVPPEWLELVLTLDCPHISNNAPTIEDPGPLDIEAPAGAADLTAPAVDDLDPADNLADGTLTISNDAPQQFVLDLPTDVTWTVTDDLGASASVVQTITAVDTTAPVLTLPEPAPATGDNDGAVVSFDVSATDTVDTDVPVDCTPASGDLFPVGTTEVACTATDDSGNEGTGAFDVVVNAVCNGLVVTINMNTNGGNGTGTAGADVILGTPGDDVIDGLAGDDTICAGAGNDQAVGGDGNDTIFGEAGRDILRGNPGIDTMSGGDGNDRVLGGIGNDIMSGDAGNDFLGGFGGNDFIDGGIGDDTVFGGFGADTIVGGDGNDTVFGLIGNDSISGGAGNDKLNGDRGNDTISGGPGDDIIKGGNANDVLNGDDGDDDVSGGKADDTLSGGDDIDVCAGNLHNLGDTADATCETIFGVP